MKKSVLTIVYLMAAIFVLFIGLMQIQSVDSFRGVDSTTLTCEGVFGSHCPDPGQCSYNLTSGTANCVIECLSKYTFSGREYVVKTRARCNWKSGNNNVMGIITKIIPQALIDLPGDWETENEGDKN